MADLLLGVKIGATGGPQTVREIKAIDDRVKALQEQNKRAAETAKALGEAYQLSDAEIDALVKELINLDRQTEAAAESARKAEEAYNDLSATEKAIRQLQDALAPDQNASRLLNVLGQIKAGSQDTIAVAARLKTAFNLDDEKARRLAAAVDQLGDETKDATTVARELGRELDLSDVEVDALIREMNRLKGAVDDVGDRASFLQEVFTGFARGIGERGLEIAAESIRALGSAIADTTRQSLDLADQFNAGKAALETLGVDSAAIAQSLTDVSQALGNQVGVVELLQGSYDIVSSGFTDAADVAQIAEASVKGATAGFSDFATVSNALTSVINAYGLEASDAARITDNFLAVQNAGKITLAEYGAQIGVVASIAAQAGVSIDELGAFVATATAKGVQYSSAITGIRQAIAATLKPSSDATNLAKELGIEFDSTALKTKGLSGILAELNARGIDNQETLIKLFGSVEAVAAIAPSAGEGIADFNRNLQAVSNSAGVATEGFNTIAGTAEGAANSLQVTLNNALLELGLAIEPIKAAVLEFASALATATIDNVSGLDTLADAAQRFQTVLAGNTDLIDTLATGFANLATVGVNQLAQLIDAITVFVNKEENLILIEDILKRLANALVVLGNAARFIVALAETLASLNAQFDQLPEGLQNLIKYGPLIGTLINLVNSLKTAFELVRNAIDNVTVFVTNLVKRFDFLAQNPAIKVLLDKILEVEAATSGMGAGLASGLRSTADGINALNEAANDSGQAASTVTTTAEAVRESAEETKSALERLTEANRSALAEIERDSAQAKAAILERGGTEEEVAAAETKAIQDRIEANREYLRELKALTGQSSEDAEKTAQQILQVETAIANDRIKLAQDIAAERRKEAEKAARAEADALKEIQAEQKRLAQEAFSDRQRDEGTIFSDAQAKKAEAFQEAQQAKQKAFQDAQQADQERFNDGQNAKAKAFQQQQQAAAQAFQRQQQAAADQANREFGVLTSEVERRLQLEQASSRQERQNLEAQFKAEDEQLKRRREVEAQVLRERGSILADRREETQLGPLEQAQKAFAEQQQAAAQAFQQAQQLESEAFQAQQRQEAKAFQDAQELETEAFQKRLRAEEETFRLQQRDEQRDFERRQRAEQADFNQQQRDLDKANAEAIEAILARARGGTQSLRSGGVAEGGLVQVHKDEFLIPPKGTRVVSQAESRALVRESLGTTPAIPVSRVQAGNKGIEARLDALLAVVQQRTPVVAPSSFTLNTQNPIQDAVAIQLQQIRGLTRRGLL